MLTLDLRRSLPIVLAPVVVAFFGCVPGARPPRVEARGTLSPGLTSAAPEAAKPFAVALVSPSGERVDAGEVTVVFTRPVVALELASRQPPPPVTLTPSVAGAWRWVGTSALQFVPEKRLPRATRFEVFVPAATRALDGATLGADVRSSFSTSPPALVRIEPADGATGVDVGGPIELRFDQGVADAEIGRAVRVFAGRAQTPVAFDVTRPDASNHAFARLVPRVPLPRDAEVRVEVDDRLRGEEGELASGRSRVSRFRTYGPLALGRVSCSEDGPNGRCDPADGVSIELTNPVKIGALRRALVVEPKVKLDFGYRDDDDETDELYLNAAFAAGTAYRIGLRAPLVDSRGQSLARSESRTLVFDDAWPHAEIGITGTYMDARARRDVPIASLNLDRVSLVTAKLDRDTLVALAGDGEPAFDAVAAVPGAKAVEIVPRAAKNRVAKHVVRTAEVLGGEAARGPFAVAIRWTAPGRNEAPRRVGRASLVALTDVGITAKVSREGTLVWVTRLSSAEPVAGASVEIARKGASSGMFTTDADGLALVPKAAFEPARGARESAVVLARVGDDWSFRRVDDVVDGWRHGASVELDAHDRALGVAFTDRGIYRPGDVVHVSGFARREVPLGLATPAGAKVRARLVDADGEEGEAHELTLTQFGGFSFDQKVPATAKLGSWRARVALAPADGDAKAGLADDDEIDAEFEVAEYQPAEMRAEVAADATSYVRGAAAKWTARGDYLFGAPMAGAKARVSVTRSPAYFRPPGVEELSTSDEAYESDRPNRTPRAGEIERAEATLDASGALARTVALALPGQTGPERVTFEAEVEDLSRKTVASRTTAIVHPAEVYAAVRTTGAGFAKAKEPLPVEALVVKPSGERVVGAALGVDLVRRTWSVARQVDQDGSARSVSTVADAVVAHCALVSAAKPATCALVPPEPGYYLVRATTSDRLGNPSAASVSTYATSVGEGSAGFSDGDDGALGLALDRDDYEVGDTARVLVKSPFREAEALVTVERAGVITRSRQHLVGAAPVVEVPITAELRPNAFVSVVLVRGRSKPAPSAWNAPDVGAPAYRSGYATLRVRAASRRLAVTVTPGATQAAPGAPLDVDVAVADVAGKPVRGSVTLWAVDEGVLSLVGYETPDPLPAFFAPRALRVATLETRDDLLRLTMSYVGGATGLDKGLDGGGGGSAARRDFRQTAYFAAGLLTDERGRVRAKFSLPEGLTTYRVMAVAAGEDDRFGSGAAAVTTTKTLVLRPALPRYLRAGDAIDAGVVVTSKASAPLSVEVGLAATGVDAAAGGPRVVELAPGASAEVRFAMKAPRAGAATFAFRATARGASDAVEVRRDVVAPIALEAVALSGDTTSAAGERLGDLATMRDDVGGLDVSVASTALTGLGAGVDQLVEYPYGCTEQLASRLVPLLPLRDLARDFALALPKDVDDVVVKTVAKILSNQRGDGGFGLWPESSRSLPWVSAYALSALGDARRRGTVVPKAALDAATRYVRHELEQRGTEVGRATAAFAVDVLAREDAPDVAWQRKLFAERAELPLFAKATLLHALAISRAPAEDVDALLAEVKNALVLDGTIARAVANHGDRYAEVFDSDARTTALVLRALVAAHPGDPLAPKLAAGLLADRRGGTWRSTQETAFALLALDDYRRVEEAAAPAFDARAFLGELRILDAPMRGRSARGATARVDASGLRGAAGSTLAFALEGQGRLFYEARLRYAPSELPREALDRGFWVRATARKVSPDELSRLGPSSVDAPLVTAFAAGDLVLGDVWVLSPTPRRWVVVQSPIPAGFELVDTRLATTASWLTAADVAGDAAPDDDEIAAGRAVRDPLSRRELRDDRALFFVDEMPAGLSHQRWLARATTAGTFVVPPTRAEEMYAPEVFGRTGASTFTIAAERRP